MKTKNNRIVTVILVIAMLMSVIPFSVFAADETATSATNENEVVNDGSKFGYNGYYNIISKKDYVLVPGAAFESEIVLNNNDGSRRQVLHIIEVDPSNPDVSIVPGYNQIDKDLDDEANWSHKELTEMAKYYENNLGYNIVGGMNTDLYYSSYSPRVLVYNGKSIGNFGENVATGGAVLEPTKSILYVFKDADGNVSCDVKAFNKAELDNYLAEGILLHAVGVSFGMVVNDGKLVNSKETRGNDDAARSMVGVKPDGTLVICMNDGRGANNSVGLSTFEEGEVMLALGCQWAANCDGGGSSTFLTKRVGEDTFTMRSVPCDGAQRPTAHGIFVASNVAPTGILNNINIESEYDIFAPNTAYVFGAEAIDTHGYAMDMPADASWLLSDSSFGSVDNGIFVSNGKKGSVEVQIVSDGVVVGSKTITIADPEVFKLSATSTVIPYSTADRVRTIALPIVAMIGESNVYIDDNAVEVSLSNANAGTLDGFLFTATEDTSIASVNVFIAYGDTTLTYAIAFGKGSEIVFDFENGDKAGFAGFEEAKKWSQDNGVNNTLIGSEPLAGQFNPYLSSTTFVSSEASGGQVRNGNYALAWKLDNTDAAFASWSYNVLFNTNDRVVFRDVENDMKATTIGMWVYIPVGAPGLAFQYQFYGVNSEGKAGCVQSHFMFTSASTGKQTNLNSATEADIPESRWVYMSADISGYVYVSTMDPYDTASNSRSPSFIRTYVKPTSPAELTFYIDDITLDYSSAVDDRILPVISAPTYSTSDTAVSLDNGAVINGNKIAFSATVSDNTGLDLASGRIFVDGVEIKAVIVGNTLSSGEDAVLAAGDHTVAFEVEDELGNPARMTRTFTVAGDASVEISGHNDSGATAKAQSIYYLDIKVADIANIKKLVTTIKLNNANTWETKGAIIANGFVATFDYNEVSELLTVTVELVDSSVIAGETLISIPVRVWTFDRYDYVEDKYYSPADMGNKPVVNIKCDVVYGEVTFADDSKSPFGGSLNVATELTTISSPYHIHDAELTVLNREATTDMEGYIERTYCETCQSVVDWGTIIPKIEITHNYEIVDSKFICTDDGCGKVYEVGTELFEMNGKIYYAIAGKLVTGWQFINDEYYYFDNSSYEGINGERTSYDIANTSQYFTYSFTNGKLYDGVWVEIENGTRYYYGPSYYHNTTVEIHGKTYSFRNDGTRYEGICVIKYNPKSEYTLYKFTEDGAFVEKMDYISGIYTVSDGSIYYITDGIATAPGLVKNDNGDYYCFQAWDCKGEKNSLVYVSNTNGYMPEGWYNFDADGKMILKNGVVKDADGEIRYYADGAAIYAGLVQDTDGAYYYISGSTLTAVKGCYRYITFTNGLLPEGNYEFAPDGKIILKHGIVVDADGEIRYYVDGVATYAGLVQDADGSYYYISGNGCIAIKDKTYYITFTNGLLPEGNYKFGPDGKMIVKQGIIKDADGYVRYYVDGVATYAGLVQDEYGAYYYISGNGCVAITNRSYYVTFTNGLLPEGLYEFGPDGKLIKQGVMKDSDGYVRYYVDGVATYAGLVQDKDGSYYYISGNGCVAITNRSYYVTFTNGLLPEGLYEFGADGKMLVAKKQGLIKGEDGEIRYYVDGVATYAGLVQDSDGCYYYISGSTLTAVKNTTRYVAFTNGLLPEGNYSFDANGKMILD